MKADIKTNKEFVDEIRKVIDRFAIPRTTVPIKKLTIRMTYTLKGGMWYMTKANVKQKRKKKPTAKRIYES